LANVFLFSADEKRGKLFGNIRDLAEMAIFSKYRTSNRKKYCGYWIKSLKHDSLQDLWILYLNSDNNDGSEFRNSDFFQHLDLSFDTEIFLSFYSSDADLLVQEIRMPNGEKMSHVVKTNVNYFIPIFIEKFLCKEPIWVIRLGQWFGKWRHLQKHYVIIDEKERYYQLRTKKVAVMDF
jgi:hypothetical protein